MVSKYKQYTEEDIEVLFKFKGCVPLSDAIVADLKEKGWGEYIFIEIIPSLTTCSHGNMVSYFCEKRKSVLIPDQENSLVTYEVTKKDLSTHMVFTK